MGQAHVRATIDTVDLVFFHGDTVEAASSLSDLTREKFTSPRNSLHSAFSFRFSSRTRARAPHSHTYTRRSIRQALEPPTSLVHPTVLPPVRRSREDWGNPSPRWINKNRGRGRARRRRGGTAGVIYRHAIGFPIWGMHSRKSRTFRSYIRNARARVGKVAGTRDISNRYRSRCLFDSSFILFLFSFLSFLFFLPSLFLSHSLSVQPRRLLMPRLEFDTLERMEIISFPAVSRG